MKKTCLIAIFTSGFFSFFASAEKLVLSDLKFFDGLGVPIVQTPPRLPMAFGDISGISGGRLPQAAHSLGRCGGFEDLGGDFKITSLNIESELKTLEEKIKKDHA